LNCTLAPASFILSKAFWPSAYGTCRAHSAVGVEGCCGQYSLMHAVLSDGYISASGPNVSLELDVYVGAGVPPGVGGWGWGGGASLG